MSRTFSQNVKKLGSSWEN